MAFCNWYWYLLQRAHEVVLADSAEHYSAFIDTESRQMEFRVIL